jgi:hypothetical protein
MNRKQLISCLQNTLYCRRSKEDWWSRTVLLLLAKQKLLASSGAKACRDFGGLDKTEQQVQMPAVQRGDGFN